MAIHTQESLSGFIASDPQLTETEKGDARLYEGRQGALPQGGGRLVHADRRRPSTTSSRSARRAGSTTRTSPRATTSSPRATSASKLRAQRPGVEGEEFIAKKLGHDLARTRYEVDRTPRRIIRRDAAAFDRT
jgi:hypothetical protein